MMQNPHEGSIVGCMVFRATKFLANVSVPYANYCFAGEIINNAIVLSSIVMLKNTNGAAICM